MFRDNKTQNIKFNSGDLTLNVRKYDGRFTFILINDIIPKSKVIYVTRVIKCSTKDGRKEIIDAIEKFKENPSKLFYDLMKQDMELKYHPSKPNKIGSYKKWYQKQINYCSEKYCLSIPKHFKSKITKFRYTCKGDKLILLVNDDIYIMGLTNKCSLKFSATELYKVLENIWKDTITECKEI
jgi:hypothetical protein